MSIEDLPSPPRLTCDSRKCTLNSRIVSNIEDTQIYETKTPKNLPGDAKNFIKPNSFFPFDESSSRSGSPSSSSSTSSLPSSSSSTSSLPSSSPNSEKTTSNESIATLSMDELPSPTPILSTPFNDRYIKSDLERRLQDEKITSLRTFIVHEEDSIFYLAQFKSYYGSTFFIRFDNDTTVGDERIVLFKNKEENISVNVISPTMTEYVTRESNLVTLINDSIIYNGSLYSVANVPVKEFYSAFHPSSYHVFPENSLNDIVDLAIESHKKSSNIESVYRHELTRSYNALLDNITDLMGKIQDHHSTFTEVDSLIIEETDIYYDKFAQKYQTGNPTPSDEDIKRISFLNDTSLKYTQTHFIFWSRLQERMEMSLRELEETTTNIYLQIIKDFPDIEGIPIDPSIDIERSYPGKIFTK